MASVTETRMIVLAEDLCITPEQLLTIACSLAEPVEIKATCYGLIVQGPQESVRRVVAAVRAKAPYSVFTKERGFCIGHRAKCRRGRPGGASGAPRPGFHQLELEAGMLTMIGEALEALERNDEAEAPKGRRKPLDETSLKRMVDDILLEMEAG
jgi:putative methanogenesis marker protein 6